MHKVTAWRQRTKLKLIEYKGGVCADCGLRDIPAIYDFHHRDPAQKLFRIGSGSCRGLEKQKAEADKCDLLCANCHRRRHANDIMLNDPDGKEPA